jgi:hypothetical protein
MKVVLGALGNVGLARIVYIPEVGCENFARYIMQNTDSWLAFNAKDVRLRKVTVAEHEGNSAYVERRVL